MISLDAVSLFTNVRLGKTVDSILDRAYNQKLINKERSNENNARHLSENCLYIS